MNITVLEDITYSPLKIIGWNTIWTEQLKLKTTEGRKIVRSA
jgi:hypothetical protein